MPSVTSVAKPSPALDTLWVSGDALGVSRQRVHQLYQKLAPLAVARKEGSVYLFRADHPEIAPRIARKASADAKWDLTGCSERQITDVRRKERILRTGQSRIPEIMTQRSCGRTVAVEWFCREQSVADKTYRRWESLYRTGGVKALVDTRGGNASGDVAFDEQAKEYGKALWLDERKWSAKLCYELTCAEAEKRGWIVGSYRTLLVYLKSIPRAVKILARHGNKAYESECAPRVKRDRSVICAGDWYCGDECTLDLYARAPNGKGGWKRIRPILTAWECERSRVFVGWHIDDRANSDTILAAFKMALRDWGTPRRVTVDNGHDYTSVAGVTKKTKRSAADSERVASVFTDLEISPHFTIPYNPQSKLIESHFNPVHERFDKLWESYCGNEPANRPEGANQIPPHALPTLEEVRQAFAAWLSAHHERPQNGNGMFGYSPLQSWEHFRPDVVRERIDDRRLDLLCARYHRQVTVSKHGVRYQGIDYDHPALFDLLGRKVWLKIDPDRADQVQVADVEHRRLICVAQRRELAGATQKDIRERQRAKAQRKKAIKKYVDTNHVDLDTDIDGLIRAQLARNQSQQQLLREAAGPERVQLVRPDVKSDCIAASRQVNRAFESASKDEGEGDTGDVYNILAAQADADQESGASLEIGDDDAIDFEAFADAIPFDPGRATDSEGDESADGFAALADLAPEVRRYGAAG